ncbi:MAG: type I-U CRISPR-associated helicase/endonuclease Cas3, partial [Alphaproteobacteria bacterium]|nr:type I-U CRISPR-associated helicase/endonuclease Cas3 [Alphaproteobacteria bacterium]
MPVLARRLRGGVPREDDWARTPSQPTILCSTVDQVGSRLLFRGYGISDRMKPVHAGLLGSDCLILLDEAHLAEPFRQTLTAIGQLRQPDGAPWQAVVLTATPVETNEERWVCFALDDQDRGHPILSRRLTASKPAKLVEIQGRQGVASEDRRISEIADQTKLLLNQLRTSVPTPAIGVVVNRVLRARGVYNLLKKELPDADIELIIGPARAAEREQRARKMLEPVRTGASRRLDRPLVLVATQTIEAGVDIDLDGLVTEAAPLDALRQRFGRLNRAGRPIASSAVILAHKDDVGAKADPVYGDRIAKTWATLTAVAGSGGEVDFGIAAFSPELLEKAAALSVEKKDAPVLMPAYADLWSQTSPIPNADPEPALFLHGPERPPATVQVVWRADLEFERDGFDAEALLAAMPPKPAEAVEVSLAAARRWLREEPAADFSDTTGREDEDDGSGRGWRAFRWAGRDNARTGAIYADQLRPHDLIVVPCSSRGCDAFGWDPASTTPVTDVADLAAAPFQARRFALRLFPALVETAASGFDETAAETRFSREMLGLIADFRDGGARAKIGELIEAHIDAGPPSSLEEKLKL